MTSLTLGASILTSMVSMSSCDHGGDPIGLDIEMENQTANFLVVEYGIEKSHRICTRVEAGKSVQPVFGYWTEARSISQTTNVIGLDSVIEVRSYNSDTGATLFEFTPTFVGKNRYVYTFSDAYLSELADTMRKMGVPPYTVSHEYVVNNTGQDFTLRCISAERTWEYKIASGDSADIERRWLMEWTGTEQGHYEFDLSHGTLEVWPVGTFAIPLANVQYGDSMFPRRYFDFTVSREGGGARRYEITDTLLGKIAAEMAKVRKAQPGLFEK